MFSTNNAPLINNVDELSSCILPLLVGFTWHMFFFSRREKKQAQKRLCKKKTIVPRERRLTHASSGC